MSAASHDALDQVLAENRQYQALIGAIAYQVTDVHVSTGGAVATIRDLLVKAGIIKAPFTFVESETAGAASEGCAAPATGEDLPAWLDQLGSDYHADPLTRVAAVAKAAPEYVHLVEPAPAADTALADRQERG